MAETPGKEAAVADKGESRAQQQKARDKLVKKRDWRTDVNDEGQVVILRKGEERSPNGDNYAGEFLDGEKHGRGIMKFGGGNVYEGLA